MHATALHARQQKRILLIASLVSSLVMLDSNIVAVALPTIARSLKADFADVQWVITAYVLPFAALLLAAGSFGDRVGRRGPRSSGRRSSWSRRSAARCRRRR